MEFTDFRNLKRRQFLKELEEVQIHGKRRRYNNENVENNFVRSCLVTTTVIINRKTSKKTKFMKGNRTDIPTIDSK